MTIRFTKGSDGTDTLTCFRADGSCTWAASSVGTAHDLIHYAVEMTLGCRDAFYGLVARGRDIGDFGTRNGVKDTYPAEALRVEAVVGFLQADLLSGGRFTAVEFHDMMTRQFPDLSAPEGLTDEMLDRLRASAREYLARWRQVADGKAMELDFPE